MTLLDQSADQLFSPKSKQSFEKMPVKVGDVGDPAFDARDLNLGSKSPRKSIQDLQEPDQGSVGEPLIP